MLFIKPRIADGIRSWFTGNGFPWTILVIMLVFSTGLWHYTESVFIDMSLDRFNSRVENQKNLIVNHLAIPHCWSEQKRRFRGFFITLAHAVQVNNEPVSHVLIACAAADARHELKIFSYLASVLYRHPAETICELKGYADFIGLLKQ